MAWWKTFPSPLLLLSLFILLLTAFNTSNALRPDSFTLISHTREYAVYANDDGVPKLEKDDIPANDPQVILDAPISTATPKPLQPSFTPVSEGSQTHSSPANTTPNVSDVPSKVTVSESVTHDSSSDLDQPPTVAQPVVAPSSSTAANPPANDPSPSPSSTPLAQQHSTPINTASASNAGTTQDADDSLSDHISSTSDDVEDQQLQPEETTTMLHDSSDPFVVEPPMQPATAASSVTPSSVALSMQPPPSSSAVPPSHTSPSDPQSSSSEPEMPKPNVSASSTPSPTEKAETNPPENSPVSAAPNTMGTVIAPGTQPPPSTASTTSSLDTGAEEQDLELEPLESAEAQEPNDAAQTPLNGGAIPASEPTQDENSVVLEVDAPTAPENTDTADLSSDSPSQAKPSPASPAPQQLASQDAAEEPAVTDASSIPDDENASSEQGNGAVIVLDSNPKQPASDILMNVDEDEAFTCTYFGSGTVPGYGKPDDDNLSGDVSTFAAKSSDFPDLAPEYLSHTHGNSWSYSFSVDETFVYDVVLGYAEVYDKACDAGQDGGFRTFTSSVGEQTVKMDVMAVVGCGKPLQKLYPKIPASSGTISIVLEKVSQQAILSTMCYKKAGKVDSQSSSDDTESPTQGDTSAVPVSSKSPVPTAVPPSSPGGDGDQLTGTSSADPEVATGPSYSCVNFGPAAINGYDMYDPDAISGETGMYEGSGMPRNALPEAYWHHIYGKTWTYSLEVSTNTSQDLVLGYAETFPEACELDKNASFRVFSVSAGGGSQIVDVMKSVGCGAIFQTTFASVTPVNEEIEISFSAVSGDAMLSLICYSDATPATQGPGIVTGITVDSSNASMAEEGTLSSSESGALEPSQTPDPVNSLVEEAPGGTCFTFGKTNVAGFVNEEAIPPTVTYYKNPGASVSGAENEAIFSSNIFGPQFDIELHVNSSEAQSVFVSLAEVYEPACVKGKRVFSITIDAFSKTIDVFDEAGCSAALILRIDEVSPDVDGNIRIAFSAIEDNAMVSSVCVTKSVSNSLGVPSLAVVSKLPPPDKLDSSAGIAIETSQSETDKPSNPYPSSESNIGDNPVASGSVISSDGHKNGDPENSPFPEFNGLIDATVTVSPVVPGSQPLAKPVSASDPEHNTSTGEAPNVELVHPNIVISDFGEDGTQTTDVLLPSNFSQTTFGEASSTPSHSPTAGLSDGPDTTGSMHGSDSDASGSSGFPKGSVDGLEANQNEGDVPPQATDVIIVIDEDEAPSPSPSPGSSSEALLTDENEGPSPSADVSPAAPSDAVTSASPSASPTPEVIIMVGENDATSESPLPSPSVAEPSPSPSAPTSAVVLTVEDGDGNGIVSSASPSTTDVPQSSAAGATSASVSSEPTPSIAPSPSATMSSDDDSPPTVSDPDALLEDDSLEVIPTAVPAGGFTTTSTTVEDELTESPEASAIDSSNPVTITISLPSASPTPVSVVIPPSNESDQPVDSVEDGEVQILVTDTETESVAFSPSAVDASELPVSPTATAEPSITPSAPVTDNQIEIVVTAPTVTPTPGTAPPSSTGDDELEDVIVEDDDSETSAVEAPDGVSLADEGLGASGDSSTTSSPSPSVVVSVTGADTVIIESGQVEPSPVPAVSIVPPSAPQPVVEVAEDDADVIEVSEDGQGGTSPLTGNEKVPSILEGQYKELIGTKPAGNGFSIGMGIFGALLVLLLLVFLFFAIRSDGVAYSYSSHYSGRKPDDYGEPSQGGYTEGVSQGPVQSEPYTGGEDAGRYNQGVSAESRPVGGGVGTFEYEMPEGGLGGVGGSYGNAEPDTYAEYSSLNLQENPATMDNSNVYTRSEGLTTEEGRTLGYGSGTGAIYGAGGILRDSQETTEHHYDDHAHGPTGTATQATYQVDRTTDMYEDEPLQETTLTSDVQQRISQFNQDSQGASSIQPGPVTEEYSLNDHHSTARPNTHVSESSGKQGRNFSGVMYRTGYETVDKETRKEYAALRETGNVVENTRRSRRSSAHEYPEGTLSISSTPSAAPSPYETGMKEQLVMDSDSGNAYQRSPVLAPSESISGASVEFGDRRSQQRTAATASVLDDFRYNESSHRVSSRQGAGTPDLQSELSNDGPWPWWWSDQKDQTKISTGFRPSDMDYYGESIQMDKENSSLPSNSQSPVEKSSSALSTEDAKAAVIVNDPMILKPSEIARRGHLPTSRSTWQRQYSSTSDGTSYEHENNPYFDELRRRREPYVKTVANRLSTGVNTFTRQSGESMLEEARQEFEKEHEARKSSGFGTGASSWTTQGVYV
ncbi:hypothetical protein BWQ96_02282 [Gracilariopsis chorda]|uniref:Uncharacterized protein n=1 Tax=Gracilariopsis chorda TaxID=448386 RepID=A0A2V3J0F7_9FLOR|nr:hypothetical protein BWQ96_02282 [Gracilariopsis chorda]|eukprot:PXF47896.1 hypothetical protein BWQ96_02282 [Gracilariopsis chorda]